MSKDEVGAARVFAIFGALVPLFIGMIWVFDPVVDIMGLKPKGDGGHFFIEGWVPGWPLLWLGVKLLVYGVAGPGEQELAKKVLLGIFMFSLPAALGVLMLAGGLITIVFAGKIGVASKTVLTVVAWVIVGSALAYATRWMRVS
jgi:O-antigen/teichoic acid export membrane protein